MKNEHLWQWLVGILVMVLLGLGGFMLSIESRLSKLEGAGARYSQEEHDQFAAAHDKEHTRMDRRLERLERYHGIAGMGAKNDQLADLEVTQSEL